MLFWIVVHAGRTVGLFGAHSATEAITEARARHPLSPPPCDCLGVYTAVAENLLTPTEVDVLMVGALL